MRIRNDKYENLQRQKLKAAILGSPAQKYQQYAVNKLACLAEGLNALYSFGFWDKSPR